MSHEIKGIYIYIYKDRNNNDTFFGKKLVKKHKERERKN